MSTNNNEAKPKAVRRSSLKNRNLTPKFSLEALKTKQKRSSISWGQVNAFKFKEFNNPTLEETKTISQEEKDEKHKKFLETRRRSIQNEFVPSKMMKDKSKELAEDWGINLGENLTLEGRILSQPTLIFAKHKEIIPRNGIFRTDVTYNGAEITRDNLMYIYSRRDKADIRSLMNGLLNKASSKGIEIRAKINDLYSYGINKTYSWEEIKSELKNIHFSHKLRMIIVFCDQNIQRCYNKFKEYLTNVIKIDSQFINTRNLKKKKRQKWVESIFILILIKY